MQPVDAPRRLQVAGAVGLGRDRIEVEGDADLMVAGPPDRLDREPMAHQQVMGGGDRTGRVDPTGSVHAGGVPEEGRAPRLVQRRPRTDPVAESIDDEVGVLGESKRRVALRPSTGVLELLRQIPVVEREPGRDASAQQLVDEPTVEVEPALVRRPAATGLHAWPRHREAVVGDAQIGHQCDVLAPPVVVVDGDVAGVAADDPARRVAVGVPDRVGPAVGVVGAFDLVRGGGRSPGEVVGEVGEFDLVDLGLGTYVEICHALTPPSMIPPTICLPKAMKMTVNGTMDSSVPVKIIE